MRRSWPVDPGASAAGVWRVRGSAGASTRTRTIPKPHPAHQPTTKTYTKGHPLDRTAQRSAPLGSLNLSTSLVRLPMLVEPSSRSDPHPRSRHSAPNRSSVCAQGEGAGVCLCCAVLCCVCVFVCLFVYLCVCVC